MSSLSILLLGPPEICVDGEPVRLTRRKAVGLLAYLASNPANHLRDSLATLLWPESNHSTARANLRRTLSNLTRAIGLEYFTIDRESVRLRVDAGIYIDQAAFYGLISQAQSGWPGNGSATAEPGRLAQLATAADLVRGLFLEGFSLSDSVLFDDWQMLQTESIHRELASALAQLTDGYRALGDPQMALSYARRWVALDPFHELANRSLMTSLAETDQSAVALRHFRAYERLLDHELDVTPGVESIDLFDAIRSGQFPATHQATAQEKPRLQPVAQGDDRPMPQHNLPRQMTSFIGRRQEMAEIERLLCHEAGCQLVTLVGSGGVGKTRLALSAAEALAARFPDGVCFVPLIGVDDATFMPSAIAEGLRLQITAGSSVPQQLQMFLRNKSLLLVLDNLEQLLTESGHQAKTLTSLVLDLLAEAPGLRLLITSRQPLFLQPEWVVSVGGLGVPSLDDAELENDRSLQTYGAMELFDHRARRLRSDFDWRLEWNAMARICRHVEGLPLGIELAAPWIQSLSCDEIADQIEQDMDLLTAAMRDVEPRHRSIRHVFEQTWQMLSDEERHVLSRLSICQGGFTRLAAEQVAGVKLSVLSMLVGKTLLRRRADGRYDSQELLRQFCADKLALDPAALERTRDRHATFFTNLLAHRYEALLVRRPAETYYELSAEINNIHSAWSWAMARGNLVALDNAFEVYWQLLDYRGAGEAIIDIFGHAAKRLEDGSCSGIGQENRRLCLLGEVLIPHGQRRSHNWGQHKEGTALAERGLALIRRADPTNRQKLFWALTRMSMIYLELDSDKSAMTYEECIRISRASNDRYGLMIAYAIAAWHFILRRDVRQAAAQVQRSVEYASGFGTNWWSLLVLELQAMMAMHHGHYATVDQVTEEIAHFTRSVGKYHQLCNVQVLRALLARIRGDYAGARKLCLEAMALVERSGVPEREAFIKLGLSALARLEGDYAESARLLDEGEAVLHRLHLVNQASFFAERGRLAYAQGDYAAAATFLRQAAVGHLVWLPHDNFDSSLVDLGNSLCALNEPDGATYLFRALRKSRDEHTLPRALQAIAGIARLRAQSGRPTEALELARLVHEHPVTWHEHRVRADKLARQLEETLLCEEGDAGRHRLIQKRDAWAVVDDLLTRSVPSRD